MKLRLFFLFLFCILLNHFSSAQGLSSTLINGADWRLCGNYEKSDTLVFHCVNTSKAGFSCSDKNFLQIMIYKDLRFRLLNWENEVCHINLPGTIELNDNNGELRFYFEDGTSRDYLLIFLNKQKLILVDRNY